MEFNHYQILGINQNATDAEIKAAYKELAKKYHPDKHDNNIVFEEHFKKINAAYQILSNKQKRTLYDYKLTYKATQQAPPAQNANSKKPQAQYRQTTTSQTKPDSETDKKTLRKVYIITIIALVTIGIAAVYFYNFMNHYTAEKEYEEGLQLEAQKKYHFALQSYSSAIAYDNHFTPALVKKAQLRIMLWDDYNGAYYDLSNAIKYDKNPNANLYFQRAKCLLKLKKREDALADLNEAERINPAFDSISFYKAELHCYFFHHYNTAIEEYKLALNKNPNMADAWFGKGISELELNQYDLSIKDISKAIAINDKEGRYYYYRAYANLQLKDTLQACNDWHSAANNSFEQAQVPLDSICKIP